MDQELYEVFKERNKQLLINSLNYDIDRNITSMLESMANVFNYEFSAAKKNIRQIYEDAKIKDTEFVIVIIDTLKVDSYRELERLLDIRRQDLEAANELMTLDEENMKEYYDYITATTKLLLYDLKKAMTNNLQKEVLKKLNKMISKEKNIENKELLLSRIEEYITNRLFGKLESKIQTELSTRDANLVNKAGEGYLRYLKLCSKTEELL